MTRCTQHPAVNHTDFSSLCNDFLKKAGVSELIPFMVSAGIHDDVGFSMLCRQDEAARDLVIKAAKGHITLFQRLALKFALRKVDEDGYI